MCKPFQSERNLLFKENKNKTKQDLPKKLDFRKYLNNFPARSINLLVLVNFHGQPVIGVEVLSHERCCRKRSKPVMQRQHHPGLLAMSLDGACHPGIHLASIVPVH